MYPNKKVLKVHDDKISFWSADVDYWNPKHLQISYKFGASAYRLQNY